MTEYDQTHTFSMRCETHGTVEYVRCRCGHDHGSTEVECGPWCPEYTVLFMVSKTDG